MRWVWGFVVALLVTAAGLGAFSVVEGYDPFCASCHRLQEVTYVRRATEARQTAVAVDLAARHAQVGLACVACHRGSQSLPDRATALLIGARNTWHFVRGIETGGDPRALALSETSCWTCHADVVERPGFENHFHNLLPEYADLPQVRASPENLVRCVDCHVSHEEAPDFLGFVKDALVLPQCERCHTVWGRGPRQMTP